MQLERVGNITGLSTRPDNFVRAADNTPGSACFASPDLSLRSSLLPTRAAPYPHLLLIIAFPRPEIISVRLRLRSKKDSYRIEAGRGRMLG